jgi:uncharacterized membrane protein YeaQ/YmgE (transglycosylase-associated protein family)
MGFFSWVFVGLIAGLIARAVTGDQKSGCLYTVAVGVLGAVIGGWLMQAIDSKGVTEFGLRSVLVAALGAVLLLLVLQAIAGRRNRR